MLVPKRWLRHGCVRRGGAGAALRPLCALLLGAACALLIAARAEAGFDEGLAAYNDGNYAAALPEFLFAAQDGDPKAQNMLGLMYDLGRGVPEDDSVAVRWYRLAAEQNYATAQYNLGLMYLDGTGVEQNDVEAAQWFLKAADRGHAAAQNRAGLMWRQGKGLPKDDNEAVAWFRLAAEQGHANAQYNLGYMYEVGDGVAADAEEAKRWYRLAAEQNHEKAKDRLAKLEAQGTQQAKTDDDSSSQGSPVFAKDRENCESDNAGRRVAGCRAVIASGGLAGDELAEVYDKLGTGHAALQQLDTAIAAYSKAIELDPDKLLYRRDRAADYTAAGRTAEALKDYGAVLEVWPFDRPAREARGGLRLAAGDREQALADFMVAHVEACREADSARISVLQGALTDTGFFKGEQDGTCSQALYDALVAATLGTSVEAAQSRNYAIYTDDELIGTLTGVTFQITDGYPAPFGEPQMSRAAEVSTADRNSGVIARIVAPVDSATARATLEFLVYDSVAAARRNWKGSVLADTDEIYETWTGHSDGADGIRRELAFSAPVQRVDGPPPDELHSAHWPPDGRVVVRASVQGAPHTSREVSDGIAEAAALVAVSGAKSLWAKQGLILQAREEGKPSAQNEPSTKKKTAQPQPPTPVLIFDPEEVLQYLAEGSFKDIKLPPPFSGMTTGEIRPNESKAGGLYGRALFQNDRVNGLIFNVYDTPQSAHRGFELRLEDYGKTEAGEPAVIERQAWENFNEDSSDDIDVFCAHDPLSERTPPNQFRCVAFDPSSQVLVETLSQEPLTNKALRDRVLGASLDTLEEGVWFADPFDYELEPIKTVALTGPVGPKLRDPAALAAALAEPKMLADFAAELKARGNLRDPFQAPQREVLEEFDGVLRERGVFGRVVFPMDGADTQNGTEFFIYRDSDAAEKHVENLIVTPDSRYDDGGWDLEIFGSTITMPDHDLVNFNCARAAVRDGVQPRQVRCAYHPPGSQIAIAIYSYAREPLDRLDLNRLNLSAVMVLDVALPLALRVEENLPGGDEVQRDPAAILTALSDPQVMADLAAALKDRANFHEPFEKPQHQILEDAHPGEREYGLVGYVDIVMDGPDWENGVEFNVYRDSTSANDDYKNLNVTPESIGDDGRTNAKGELSTYTSEHGVRLEFPCAQMPETDGRYASEKRCTYHAAGSQVAVTVYAYAPGPYFGDIDKPSISLVMATVLEEAIKIAKRVEDSVPASSQDAAPPGPSAETLQKMNDLATRIGQQASGTADFVYSDGGYGLAKRLLLTDGVALDGASRLRVDRRACLALLTVEMAQGNECRQEQLFKPYSLEIDLTRLDPDAFAIEQDNGKSGVQGWSLRFACAAGVPCARVTSDAIEAKIVSQGFEETLDQPHLFLHCISRETCAALAEDLRALIALAPRDGPVQQVNLQPMPQPGPTPAPTPAPTPTPAPQPALDGLVGVWQLQGVGTLEFRPDGTYSFYHPINSHSGTYTAKNGKWTLSSKTPTFPWEDGGTYELIDKNTLHLVGKLGGAVWQRLAAQ